MSNPILTIRIREVKYNKRRKTEITLARYIGTYALREIRYKKVNGKNTDIQYPILDIRTEKELAVFLRNFGYGLYTVLGHKKGIRGGYVFWKGDIRSEGWIFDKKAYLNNDEKKEIENYEKELNDATDEDLSTIHREISQVKQIAKDSTKYRKYGFYPFLIPSGRRGQINFWEDVDKPLEQFENKEEMFIVPESNHSNINKIPKKKFNEMSLQDINNNF